MEQNSSLLIDAEESWIQDSIDGITEELMEKWNRNRAVIYTTIQMYRVDRKYYLHNLVKSAKDKGFFLGVELFEID